MQHHPERIKVRLAHAVLPDQKYGCKRSCVVHVDLDVDVDVDVDVDIACGCGCGCWC